MDTKKIGNNLFNEIRKLKLVNEKGGNIMPVKEADKIIDQYNNAALRKKEKLFVPELNNIENVVSVVNRG